jgi:hypothetical protein
MAATSVLTDLIIRRAPRPQSRNHVLGVVMSCGLNSGTSQTPGSERIVAISANQGINTSLFVVALVTGVIILKCKHTIASVPEGERLACWGERRQFSTIARTGMPHTRLLGCRT